MKRATLLITYSFLIDGMEDIFAFYESLPMQGPGDDAITKAIYSDLKMTTGTPLILDVACGTGRQTAAIASSAPGATIVATDIHIPFLQTLKKNSGHEVVASSMYALPFKESAFDLIWSEGAIYIMGFSTGLTAWKPLLKDTGYLVVSEICWFDSSPPDELRTYWEQQCPAIQTEEDMVRDAEGAGYEVILTKRLPMQAWEDYYAPIILAIENWKKNADTEVMAFLLEMEEEIRIFREYGSYYGYMFIVVQKKGG